MYQAQYVVNIYNKRIAFYWNYTNHLLRSAM